MNSAEAKVSSIGFRHVPAICLAVTICGCGGLSIELGDGGYRETVVSAKDMLPIAVQMESLYGKADHFIEQYSATHPNANRWDTNVYIGKRYELTMQAPIAIDRKNHTFSLTGPPKLYLQEYLSVTALRGGGCSAKPGKGFTLSAEDWARVYASKGDFSVLGITLNPTPAEGFELYMEANSRHGDPISLAGK